MLLRTRGAGLHISHKYTYKCIKRHFYHTMLCNVMPLSVCLSVYLFVSLSQVRVLPKWLKMLSNAQCHTIANRLKFSDTKNHGEIPMGNRGTKCMWSNKKLRVSTNNSFFIAGSVPAYSGPQRDLCRSNVPAQGEEGNWWVCVVCVIIIIIIIIIRFV